MRSSVDFWYRRISRRATVPGPEEKKRRREEERGGSALELRREETRELNTFQQRKK